MDTLELLIYLVVALLCIGWSRIIEGIGHAAFYAKGQQNIDSRLQKYVNNYHYVASPEWYSKHGAVFFFVLTIARLLHPEFSILSYSTQLFASYLITIGASGLGNYHYQGYINLSEHSPFENPKENPKSEFAFGPIRFWWSRPWGGKRRKYVILLGAVSIAVGLYLIVK